MFCYPPDTHRHSPSLSILGGVSVCLWKVALKHTIYIHTSLKAHLSQGLFPDIDFKWVVLLLLLLLYWWDIVWGRFFVLFCFVLFNIKGSYSWVLLFVFVLFFLEGFFFSFVFFLFVCFLISMFLICIFLISFMGVIIIDSVFSQETWFGLFCLCFFFFVFFFPYKIL